MEEQTERLELTEEEGAKLLRRQEAETPRIAVWQRFRAFTAVERWISKVEDWFNIVGVVLILVLMSVTVITVIGRYFFAAPLRGQVDISELIMAGVVFFSLAFTMRVGGHVRIEVLLGILKGRGYHLTEFFTLLLALFLFAVTFISSLNFTIRAWEVGDITGEVLLPVWPAKLSVVIGSFMICVRLIIKLIQHMSQLVAGIERKEI